MRSAVRLLVAAGLAVPAAAATPPNGFVDSVVGNGSTAVGVAYEPGSGALFIIEKGFGDARVLRKSLGSSTATTARTLDCVDGNGERGLLGIAFDPDYLQGASSRYVYLYYTRSAPATGTCAIAGTSGSRNRVSRFLESGGVLGDEQLILEGPVLTFATNHNAGTLRFAPDETLFVSMGDNGTYVEARNLNDLRGKILRIRRDGAIPADNPFFGLPGRRGEIWAWGFRNPFRFSIDPETSIPWIGDVGEGSYEEIDRGVAGGDYGWPCFEGPNVFQACNPAPQNPIAPALYYGHFSGTFTGASITGGPVYRSGTFPQEYEGQIFFGDYSAGWIRRGTIDAQGDVTNVQMFIPDASGVVDIVQAPNGCLAWVSVFTGDVHETCPIGTDIDGDGYTVAEGDCAEGDASSYPGAPDLCDGKNNDCAGNVDDATCATFDAVDGVDGRDLALLGRIFGTCSGGAVDYTHNGCVDGDDLAVMSAVWGCRGTVPICP